MNDVKEIMERYTQPTKFDFAPFGTMARVMKDNEAPEVYIQTGSQESPDWKHMGWLLERVYESRYTDKAFIDECLRVIDQKNIK